jgi:hypothetical protein
VDGGGCCVAAGCKGAHCACHCCLVTPPHLLPLLLSSICCHLAATADLVL